MELNKTHSKYQWLSDYTLKHKWNSLYTLTQTEPKGNVELFAASVDIGLGRRLRNSQWRRRAAAAAANAQCCTPESKAVNDVPLEAPGDAPAVLRVKRFSVNEKVKFDS